MPPLSAEETGHTAGARARADRFQGSRPAVLASTVPRAPRNHNAGSAVYILDGRSKVCTSENFFTSKAPSDGERIPVRSRLRPADGARVRYPAADFGTDDGVFLLFFFFFSRLRPELRRNAARSGGQRFKRTRESFHDIKAL